MATRIYGRGLCVTPEGVCANLTTLLSPDKSTDLLFTLRFNRSYPMCGERYCYVVRYGGQTMVRAADCPGVARMPESNRH
ncbi:hypothetical protein [Bacteroides neonati]|uniref:hypothetical protein n=1 Tax=Bacteroides neonati TaxID=1347393 RepID=UPI0011DE18A1|nr:hypothetical protein [Bacteroides neonati]